MIDTAKYDAALRVFIAGCQAIIDAHHRDSKFTGKPDVLSTTEGARYTRLLRRRGYAGLHDMSGSVHCFVDKTNGDILKAASWKAPAKHARGNLFDASNGLALMGQYGPAYLR